MKRVDISISNNGSGFFGITGETRKGRAWMAEHVPGQHRGQAWTDDRRYAMDIAQGAQESGMEVR